MVSLMTEGKITERTLYPPISKFSDVLMKF